LLHLRNLKPGSELGWLKFKGWPVKFKEAEVTKIERVASDNQISL
jgi:hypothetical protein